MQDNTPRFPPSEISCMPCDVAALRRALAADLCALRRIERAMRRQDDARERGRMVRLIALRRRRIGRGYAWLRQVGGD